MIRFFECGGGVRFEFLTILRSRYTYIYIQSLLYHVFYTIKINQMGRGI